MSAFSMRCVDCGLLLSEAEEADGFLCNGCRCDADHQKLAQDGED